MSLNMRGHLQGDFISHRGVPLHRYSSAIVDYEYTWALTHTETFDANIQQADDEDIQFLQVGGERLTDARVVHRNDGLGIELSTPEKLADILYFDGHAWKAMNVDYRPWRGFCRAVVIRLDATERARIENAGS